MAFAFQYMKQSRAKMSIQLDGLKKGKLLEKLIVIICKDT